MYIGDTGSLGLRFLARELFECPQAPRKLSVVIEGAKLEMLAISAPVSVEPRKAGKPIYLIEVASRLHVRVDDPPSISAPEVLDLQTKPAAFRRADVARSGIAIANALSSELKLVSCRAGVATEVRFSRGAPTSDAITTPSTSEDGLAIALVLDAEIFPNASFSFKDLAEELRDFALRRRVCVEVRDAKQDLVFAMKGTV
jgi:hypothetical protein